MSSVVIVNDVTMKENEAYDYVSHNVKTLKNEAYGQIPALTTVTVT